MKLQTKPIMMMAIALFVVCQTALIQAAEAAQRSGLVTVSQTVNAAPDYVFQAVQQIRSARDHVLESYDGKNAIVREIWHDLPVLGDAVCTYKETEVSQERIDYKLISSDKITKFEGSWIFQPLDGGKKTLVTLTTATQTALKLPFIQMITDRSAQVRSLARVRQVAFSAECAQARKLQ
jgi:hypothetical protein